MGATVQIDQNHLNELNAEADRLRARVAELEGNPQHLQARGASVLFRQLHTEIAELRAKNEELELRLAEATQELGQVEAAFNAVLNEPTEPAPEPEPEPFDHRATGAGAGDEFEPESERPTQP